MNNLTISQWVILVTAVSLVLLGLRLTLNGIVLLIVPTAMRCRFEGGPEDFQQLAEQHNATDLLAELRHLGFESLGIKSEHLPVWGKVRELSLAAPHAKVFASVVPWLKRSTLVYFYTTFSDGALVLTADRSFDSLTMMTTRFRSFPILV
jgi:hypothetical protein